MFRICNVYPSNWGQSVFFCDFFYHLLISLKVCCLHYHVLCLLCWQSACVVTMPYSLCPTGGSVVTCEKYWFKQPEQFFSVHPVEPKEAFYKKRVTNWDKLKLQTQIISVYTCMFLSNGPNSVGCCRSDIPGNVYPQNLTICTEMWLEGPTVLGVVDLYFIHH